MKFTVDYPIVTVGYDPALVTAAGMTRVAQAVEDAVIRMVVAASRL